MSTINIGKDFSEVPSGRYDDDGDYNGTAFRENHLKDIFLRPDEYDFPIQIILDDQVEGYGSSFLNEAFGGLVRKGYAEASKVLESFDITYTDEDFEYYKERIITYITEAKYGSEKND